MVRVPREVVTAGFIAAGAFVDLPEHWWLKLPFIAAISVVAGRLGFYNAEQWHEFETVSADFRAIEGDVPRSPKLMYLVFDHYGSTRKNTPFIHFPAWIQAKKGGWLSWHFVGWDFIPYAIEITIRTCPLRVPTGGSGRPSGSISKKTAPGSTPFWCGVAGHPITCSRATPRSSLFDTKGRGGFTVGSVRVQRHTDRG